MALFEKRFPVIIAEAGVNHNGSLDMALKLVDAASAAKADYIKFQTFQTEKLVAESAPLASYQRKNCQSSSQFEMLKQLELTDDEFHEIKKRCDEKGIGFLSTPFDERSLKFLEEFDMDFIKIASGEITNLPFLREVAKTGKPVIISTGMATPKEIKDTLKVFESASYPKDKITLLHCTTEYPAPLSDVNLLAMVSIKELFGTSVGYSDHTNGIEIALAATALGARVIEKHFTLEKKLPGPDHKASLSPSELMKMVEGIHNVAIALGVKEKKVSSSEKANSKVARKSIVASKPIKEGDIFTADNITVKRPGTGISPMRWDEVIGRKALRNYCENELIDML